MTSTVEVVREHLQRDAALCDTLLRGVANLRRSARWLIAEYEWDATEEAVVSALRRYAEDHDSPPLHRERELLKDTHVGLKTGLSLILLARSFEVHDRFPDAWNSMAPFDQVALLPARRRLRLMIEKSNLDLVREVLPEKAIKDIHTPASALQLKIPKTNKEGNQISLVGHVVGVLLHRGLTLYDIATCGRECSIFIPEDQAVAAFEAATDLTS